MSTIWPLPKVSFLSLSDVEEKRPAALITSDEAWSQVGHLLDLPLVVQAEPLDTTENLMNFLAENLPSQVEVVYAVGNGIPVIAGKFVAHANNVPLVLVPLALDSDQLLESFVETLGSDGLWKRIETGAAAEIIVDWEVVSAAPANRRGAAVVDILAIVTALLDWRYAARKGKTDAGQKFSPWGASVAAGLASHAIKSAKQIGEGQVEALRTLLDLLMMSVQLAHQLGHDRHQEGTEHYFAFSLRNQGAQAEHAELVAPGIMLASKLHGQDPASLREALMAAGIRVDQVRESDAQLAMLDLPNFVQLNDFPFGIAHDLSADGEKARLAMQAAGFSGELSVTGWQAEGAVPQQNGEGAEDTTPSTATEETHVAEGPTSDSVPSVSASAGEDTQDAMGQPSEGGEF